MPKHTAHDSGQDWDDAWEKDDWSKSMDWTRNQSWLWGGAIMLVGVVLLLNNFGYTHIRLHNWWALFILLPGLNLLMMAYSRYRDTGRFTAHARRTGFGGVVVTTIGLVFLLGLNWSMAGPIMLVFGGLYLLLINR